MAPSTDDPDFLLDDDLPHITAYSRRGAGREHNQDTVAVERHLWIVADGMGGHEGGKTASAVATATAVSAIHHGEDDLETVIERCHEAVWLTGYFLDQLTMGSTIVVAVRDEDAGTVQVAWCGDSRAYLVHDGELTRLTTDHNLAQDQVDAGHITADEAWDHYGQSILTSALGCGSPDIPTIGLLDTPGQGRLLLCSDGLTSGLRDEQIASLLKGDDLTEVARDLASAAVDAGSTDDTTVVVVDLERELGGIFRGQEADDAGEPAGDAVPAVGEE